MSSALKELDELRAALELQSSGFRSDLRSDISQSASFSTPYSPREKLSRSTDGGIDNYTSVLSNTEAGAKPTASPASNSSPLPEPSSSSVRIIHEASGSTSHL